MKEFLSKWTAEQRKELFEKAKALFDAKNQTGPQMYNGVIFNYTKTTEDVRFWFAGMQVGYLYYDVGYQKILLNAMPEDIAYIETGEFFEDG